MPMRKVLTVFLLSVSILTVCAQRNHQVELKNLPEHPRLLMLKGEEKIVLDMIFADANWKKIDDQIVDESKKLLSLPPLQRKMVGRRLLDVSRKALRDIFFLSYSYRMTGNKDFLDRAEKELLAVSSFTDWNPSHFLDVGEMTLGVAIGYDWLFDKLSPESKSIIRTAIVEKGLKPSLDSKYNSFVKAKNNWSQVCHAGMTYGALAVVEDEPELAKQMIERAINNIHMEDYAPDGVYPEGMGYWSYGTSFNIMFLSAIEKAFGTDFGLTELPGFKQTGYYALHMMAPDNRIFNYSDSHEYGRFGFNPTLFWFASRYKDTSILWNQKVELEATKYNFGGNRLLPAVLIWANGITARNIVTPKEKMFKGQGKAPVALMRTSWTDPDAVFVGFKLGSPAVSHAHMDIGSFVVVANNVRWAADFGMQQYESLESKGVKIWDRGQDSERWKVFRYNNMAHNTLTFDGKLQNFRGYAKLDQTGESKNLMFAISDLSNVYKGQVSAVKRGIALVENKYVTVRDEINSGEKESSVRWNMLTRTNVEIISDNKAILHGQKGKKMLLRVDYPEGVKLRTWSTESPNEWDAANKGSVFIGFEYTIQPNNPTTLQVSLIPDLKKEEKYRFDKPLNNWQSQSKK